MDGRCIISGLRQRDIDFYGVTPTDLDVYFCTASQYGGRRGCYFPV